MYRAIWTAILVVLLAASLNAQIPASKHVYIVAEENHSYESLVGSPDMPFFNGLIAKGALATQFYANQHGSIADYFWVTAGQPITTDGSTTSTFDVDNMVRHMLQLGLTYRAYAESLPYPGYTGLYNPPTDYMKRHVPLPYFTDMANSETELLKLVPTTQLDTDVQNGNEPNFAFITPDGSDDIHDCPAGLDACLQRADTWLQTHIGPLLARPEFQPRGDGLLIIWTDESDLTGDDRCSATVLSGCGGRVVVTFYGPQVKKGYQSTVTYHHQNVLRTMLQALGLGSGFPGAANTAVPMSDMFLTAPTIINVQSPVNNSYVTSPVRVVASASGGVPIVAMQVYVDYVLRSAVHSSSIDVQLPVTAGKHLVVVQSWDSTGGYAKEPITVTVTGIKISSPLAGATVSSPVNVVATALSATPIVATRIYVDNKSVYLTTSSSVDTNLTLSPGSHYLVVQNWDNTGKVTKAAESITVQ